MPSHSHTPLIAKSIGFTEELQSSGDSETTKWKKLPFQVAAEKALSPGSSHIGFCINEK